MRISINHLYVERFEVDEVSVAIAIRKTKEFLEVGQVDPIIVEKQANGLYKVINNFVGYYVLHTLGANMVKVQIHGPVQSKQLEINENLCRSQLQLPRNNRAS